LLQDKSPNEIVIVNVCSVVIQLVLTFGDLIFKRV
jgi:hypothetical protein